jgi:hypothetical protein
MVLMLRQQLEGQTGFWTPALDLICMELAQH